jgi:hypothetical protein
MSLGAIGGDCGPSAGKEAAGFPAVFVPPVSSSSGVVKVASWHTTSAETHKKLFENPVGGVATSNAGVASSLPGTMEVEM